MQARWIWIALAAIVLLGVLAAAKRYRHRIVGVYRDRYGAIASYYRSEAPKQGANGLLFIHHSCGENWLDEGLLPALLAKDYVDTFSDVDYKVHVPNDPGRPASLGESSGDLTEMWHWVPWFNDYLESLEGFQRGGGTARNRIIMFKSCYTMSQIVSEGSEPGDPFAEEATLANFRAVWRHPEAPGKTWSREGGEYRSLADVLAARPETLFVYITSPPLANERTDDESARRARQFTRWLQDEWLPAYDREHPELRNVAIYDWFDVLANPDDAAQWPNRLKAEYGGGTMNSHPKTVANRRSVELFASGPDAFLDRAWARYSEAHP